METLNKFKVTAERAKWVAGDSRFRKKDIVEM